MDRKQRLAWLDARNANKDIKKLIEDKKYGNYRATLEELRISEIQRLLDIPYAVDKGVPVSNDEILKRYLMTVGGITIINGILGIPDKIAEHFNELDESIGEGE